ncbi:type II secretion system protein GspE [Corallococcus sp. AB004]|uniref:type II secretion system ATPase GspE n=1 Tax=Corallococcus TaxID=83461 RepID=UPI000EA334F0|nr:MULTISPECIES: type II secretion system ATPase GspE [Corallococcus]RKI44936.1 type II secretion system protein GspE [Corallococcus sp. AB004]NPC71545.1 type II secretion system ATPase GspE [Corallococcus exiguus]NPD25530.1 type II secretion system ATPase GspE [Corallococcus exiguus]NRD46353.1 type II secretion system ATPase GspE [Corallococcus exiguus]RKI00076.1 type II secretion system protein GspE [Corallococcus sp. AB038B]
MDLTADTTTSQGSTATPDVSGGRNDATQVVGHGLAYLCGRPIGEILRALVPALTPEKIQEALATQQEKGGRLGEVLVGMKAVSEEDVARALGHQLDLPYLQRIFAEEVDADLVKRIPINFARQTQLLPLSVEGDEVVLAVADPLDTTALDHARLLLGQGIQPRIALASTIVDTINSVYDRSVNEAEALVDEMETTEDLDSLAHELEEPKDLLDADDEAPVIRLVNSVLFRAAKERASDIHIEPMERELLVRFRIDGVLQEVIKPPKRYQNSIIARVKVMGQLNIAEKRLPQDGRIRIKLAGRDIDIRLSTTPTSFGERIVMRLLDKTATLLDLAEIGMSPQVLGNMQAVIKRSHGIVLVTGPTGSGKTTTLYGALSKINTSDLNILTVEDPVEYQLKGIGQMAIAPKIGLTFAQGLRSFLRQDPDVIMVGEIRDKETAEIAIQASLTGHLVLSTVHTNDAAGAVTRLVDMGVQPFLVASSLTGILAQRLVRRVCPDCRQAYTPTDEDLKELGFTLASFKAKFNTDRIYRATGCPSCNRNGYRGRSGIYEFLFVDDDVRQLVLKNVDASTIKKSALAKGMTTLLDDGVRKIALGETTIAEVLSITQEDI